MAAGSIRFGFKNFLRGVRDYVRPVRPKSQGEESAVLDRILESVAVPKLFVEFGFTPEEFNCAGLIGSFEGLLIDGDEQIVRRAQRILPRRLSVKRAFLDLENLGLIRDFCADRALGILSVDVDGNDYWLLERSLDLRPVCIVVEYNASFGLRPISVPYDKSFARHAKHESGWYHGASLTALSRLCGRGGYGLFDVTASGCNAFFVRSDTMDAAKFVAPESAYRENRLRNQWSSTVAADQWQRIRHLEYVEV
ncbi:MAG TPA: hypothetical protein VHD32_07855 [Candidatus Didemnitutus sp.]|nr:hypothetical protein [Candidatus Didemnitutus sp.]